MPMVSQHPAAALLEGRAVYSCELAVVLSTLLFDASIYNVVVSDLLSI